MRMLRCVFTIALILQFSVPALPQQTSPTVQRDPQVLAILNRCAAAMGASGNELSVVAQGEMTLSRESASHSVVIKTRGPRLFRQDQSGSTGVETWVVKNGAGFRSRGNQRENLSSHATRYFRPDHLPAFSCIPDLSKFDVTLEGTEQVLDRPVYHLKLVARSSDPRTRNLEAILSEYHVFIDQQRFLVLKTSTFVFSPNVIQNRSTWETFYGDYRNIGGVLVPFHIENYLSGRKLRDIVFSDVQVGVSLSNAEFE